MSIAEALAHIEHLNIGLAQACNGLAVHPLFDGAAEGRHYPTLDEALAGGLAHVTEVSQAGDVPELRFRNDGDEAVLLLDGEELVGAKQNRVLNLTILAPPRSEILIPVSCVERGRWSWRSQRFTSANRTAYAKLRRRKMEQVSFCLRTADDRSLDQGDIWNDIAAKSARMGSFSDTGAAGAMYEKHAEDLEEFVREIRPQPTQVGAVFLVHGRVAGAEVFGSARVLAKLLPKLVRSYGLDAIEEERLPAEGRAATGQSPKAWLSRVLEAKAERHKAIGLGEDIRLEAPGAVAAALIDGKELVHLSAFARGYV